MTYTAWLSQWLNNYVRPSVKIRTYERYSKICALHIIPTLGNIPLDKITAIDLQSLVTALLTSGNNKNGKSLSANSVNTVISVIKNSLKTARLLGLTSQYVADKIRRPKTMEKQVDCFTLCEQKKIEKYVLNHKKDKLFGIILSLYTGLRIGELLALTWNDIDFENRLLSVNRQVQWYQDKTRTKDEISATNGSKQKGGGYWYFSPPKYNSYRTIEIDEFLLDILKREFEKQKKASEYYAERYYHYYSSEAISLRDANHDEDSLMNPFGTDKTDYEIQFVNRRESGEYITPRTMQHTSSVIHKQLDFIEFDFHSLRHTHATMLLENGAPMIYIKNRLGHVKVETTEKVYTNHLTDAFESQGSETLNSVFNK